MIARVYYTIPELAKKWECEEEEVYSWGVRALIRMVWIVRVDPPHNHEKLRHVNEPATVLAEVPSGYLPEIVLSGSGPVVPVYCISAKTGERFRPWFYREGPDQVITKGELVVHRCEVERFEQERRQEVSSEAKQRLEGQSDDLKEPVSMPSSSAEAGRMLHSNRSATKHSDLAKAQIEIIVINNPHLSPPEVADQVRQHNKFSDNPKRDTLIKWTKEFMDSRGIDRNKKGGRPRKT